MIFFGGRNDASTSARPTGEIQTWENDEEEVEEREVEQRNEELSRDRDRAGTEAEHPEHAESARIPGPAGNKVGCSKTHCKQ